MKNNQTGRSMIEMLGVLAIIGVLSVGALTGYARAMAKHRINKTIDHVTQITASVRSLFGGHKNYAALGSSNNAKLICKGHLFPDELVTCTTNTFSVQNNIFGGTITLTASQKRSADNKAFILTFTGIPKEECIHIATQDWGSGSSSGLIAVGVNNTNLASVHVGDSGGDKVATPSDSSHPIPMKVSQATSACNSASSNTISWKFY